MSDKPLSHNDFLDLRRFLNISRSIQHNSFLSERQKYSFGVVFGRGLLNRGNCYCSSVSDLDKLTISLMLTNLDYRKCFSCNFRKHAKNLDVRPLNTALLNEFVVMLSSGAYSNTSLVDISMHDTMREYADEVKRLYDSKITPNTGFKERHPSNDTLA